MDRYDSLKLENQLCFPLYAASKAIISAYRPFLEPLGLTYTQYICFLVLWEKGRASTKELGALLHLDSGTLTPLMKRLEQKGLIKRTRDPHDERNLLITLTQEGAALREKAVGIPSGMGACIPLSREDAIKLKELLEKLLS